MKTMQNFKVVGTNAHRVDAIEKVSGKAIYTSEFRRTQDTGKPLAAKLGLTITPVASSDVNDLVKRIKADHPKDVVLIVGHSNTIPAAVKAFGGPAVKMADDEYSAIYIVTPATGAMTLIRY